MGPNYVNGKAKRQGLGRWLVLFMEKNKPEWLGLMITLYTKAIAP